jgi:hypothetical protein
VSVTDEETEEQIENGKCPIVKSLEIDRYDSVTGYRHNIYSMEQRHKEQQQMFPKERKWQR